jgi:hypothetical protein
MRIAGVRFRENWKVYDFDAAGVDCVVGDKVIVDSERGPGFAQVVRIRKSQAWSSRSRCLLRSLLRESWRR